MAGGAGTGMAAVSSSGFPWPSRSPEERHVALPFPEQLGPETLCPSQGRATQGTPEHGKKRSQLGAGTGASLGPILRGSLHVALLPRGHGPETAVTGLSPGKRGLQSRVPQTALVFLLCLPMHLSTGSTAWPAGIPPLSTHAGTRAGQWLQQICTKGQDGTGGQGMGQATGAGSACAPLSQEVSPPIWMPCLPHNPKPDVLPGPGTVPASVASACSWPRAQGAGTGAEDVGDLENPHSHYSSSPRRAALKPMLGCRLLPQWATEGTDFSGGPVGEALERPWLDILCLPSGKSPAPPTKSHTRAIRASLGWPTSHGPNIAPELSRCPVSKGRASSGG